MGGGVEHSGVNMGGEHGLAQGIWPSLPEPHFELTCALPKRNCVQRAPNEGFHKQLFFPQAAGLGSQIIGGCHNVWSLPRLTPDPLQGIPD